MKLLPSPNITTPWILVVIQDTTKGVSLHVPYGRSPGANTLAPGCSLTRQVVLQGKPMPLTAGLYSSTRPSGN